MVLHLFGFLTYWLVVKLSVIVVVVRHLRAGKKSVLESGGGSGSVLIIVCVGGSAGP